MAGFDATVWSQTNEYYLDRLMMVNNVCAMGPTNIGHLQLPVVHSQTTMGAVVKHQRPLQDALLAADMEFSQSMTLYYFKENARSGSDKRPTPQMCHIVSSSKQNKWFMSEALQAGHLRDFPLIPVSQMAGYDPDAPLCFGESRADSWLGGSIIPRHDHFTDRS